MKKIILTLGLSALITMPNLLASDSITTEPLADAPLIVENRLKGFYIKPFVGMWGISLTGEVGGTTLNVPRIQMKSEVVDYFVHSCEMVTLANLIGGLAVGKHLNEHICIEGSAGYYHSNH